MPFGYAREDTQKFQGLGWWVGGVPRSAGSRHALLNFKKPAKPHAAADCTKPNVQIGLRLASLLGSGVISRYVQLRFKLRGEGRFFIFQNFERAPYRGPRVRGVTSVWSAHCALPRTHTRRTKVRL